MLYVHRTPTHCDTYRDIYNSMNKAIWSDELKHTTIIKSDIYIETKKYNTLRSTEIKEWNH